MTERLFFGIKVLSEVVCCIQEKKNKKRRLEFLTIIIVVSSFSLYTHPHSRAYINFRNPDDILFLEIFLMDISSLTLKFGSLAF